MTYKLPKGWKEVKLRDIGKYRNEKTDIENCKIENYVSTSNILSNRKGIVQIDELPKSNTVNVYKKNDILISNIRPYFKKIWLAEYDGTNSSDVLVIETKHPNNFKFIYYILSDDKFFDYSTKSAKGTKMPRGDKKAILEYKIILPPLKEQEAIANTLSVLDDKIENNNKIAKNLEAQAQAIFKHWIVDFEFPNEQGKPYKSSGGEMVESELGMIPKGWDVGKLGDNKLGKLISSGIDDFKGEKIYLATADVTNTNINNNQTLITMENKPIRANMQPKSNTVWFAKMKDSRKLIFVEKNDDVLKDNYIFSTGFAGIQGYETSVYYLWTYIQSDNFNNLKNSLCTGTTMQAINNKNINKIKLVIPDSKVLEKFNEIVIPLYKKNVSIRNENYILAELRDTLLPKLISGEIRLTQDFNGDAFDG